MNWISTHWLVLLFLAAFIGMIAHHAWIGKRRTHGLVDYYVGGRSMGGVAIGLSFFATYSSTNSFVGFSGQAYSYGMPWLLLAPSAVVFSLIAWLWIAPRLREFTASWNSVTIPDFIGFRFGSVGARFLAAVIILFASLLYMTAIFKGIGTLLEVFLDLPYTIAIVLVFFVVVVYTAVGGFISVVRTDVVQGILMIFAAILLFEGTIRAAGGLGSLDLLRDQPETSGLFNWNAAMPFPVLLGIIVAGTMKFMVEPRQLSRFYALEDHKATRRGMWVSTLAFLFVYSLLVPIGIYSRNIFPEGITDTDRIVPALLNEGNIFPPVVGAFLLVAMVAAAMSSLDSVLLVTASTCERDIVNLWRKKVSESDSLRATRLYVVLFAFITAVVALNPPGGIVALTALSGSLYAACFFPAIVLGLHWSRGNGTAVISSFLSGIGTLLLWDYLPLAASIHEVFPALFLSLLCYVVVSIYSRAHEAPEVQSFFTG
jgi:SSS family transporter